jgi:hypothetical protein
LLFFLIFAVVMVTPFGGCAPAGLATDDQVTFQSSVANDRKKLFDGELRYRPYISKPVGSEFSYRVDLTALGQEQAKKAAALCPGPRSTRVRHCRPFKVGGIEGAELESTNRDVEVRPIAGAKVKQVIAEPGDSISWIWVVSAKEPGNYTLYLTITTYQGDSDRALDVLRPPVYVQFISEETASHRIHSMTGFLVAIAGVIGGLTAAFLALFAFRSQIAQSFKDWREGARRRRADSRNEGYN